MPRAAKSSSTPVVPPSLSNHPLERARGNEPLVQLLAADTERILQALARAGAVAVERNGKSMNAQFCHERSICHLEPAVTSA